MDLHFSEEQNILRDMVKNIIEGQCTTDVVRESEGDEIGIPTDLWRHMKELGLLSIMLPKEYGGMGLKLLECAIIYEQFGRGLLPGPHFVSSVIAASAIEKGGSESQRSELLPQIGSGDLVVATAWLEPDNGFGPEGVQVRAQGNGGNYLLSGVKRHVFYAKAAQKLLVLARVGDAVDAVDVFLVDTDTDGILLEQQPSMAGDTQYKITFTNVVILGENRLQGGWQLWYEVLQISSILQAAYAVGGAQKALDITLHYSKERKQFDKPIGAFQALANYMADSQVQISGAQVLVWEAAWAYDEGHSIDRLAPMAKLFCCDVFRETTAIGQQIYGGYGFTLEYDIQLYFRRAKQQQMNWLDSRALEQQIAADVLENSDVTIADPFTARN